MRNWYALHCKPQQDARAELHLLNQQFEVFRPLVRMRRQRRGKAVEVRESMFPRYIFVHLDDVHENWGPIRSTRGVAGLVRWGAHVPTVPDSVIQGLQANLAEDGCVDLTRACDFQMNERVRITDGPFAGYEGLFQARTGEERVVVLLDIMQQTQKLSLPGTCIAKA